MGTPGEIALRAVSALLIALGIALGPASASEAGLLGLWRFDESSGGTAADSTSNGNTGTLYGASWVLGRFGSALSFDGDDWVDFLTTSAAIHALSGPMTVETWVKGKSTDNPGLALVFDKSHGFVDSTGWALQFQPDPGPLHFALGRGGGGAGDFGAVDAARSLVLDGDWHHVAGTFDASGMMRIYVDGNLVDGPDPLGPLTHATNSRNMEMGRSWIGSRYFTGAIDETALWDEALSQSTIQSHYQCGIGNPCPVPEPATLVLLGVGIAGLCLWRRNLKG